MWRRLCEMWSGLLFKLRSATTLYVTSAMVENDRYYYRYLWTKTQSLQRPNKTSYLIYRCVEKCEHFQVVSSFMVPLRGSYIKFVWMNHIFSSWNKKSEYSLLWLFWRKLDAVSANQSLVHCSHSEWNENRTKQSQAKPKWFECSAPNCFWWIRI